MKYHNIFLLQSVVMVVIAASNSEYEIQSKYGKGIPSYLYGEVIETGATQNFPRKIEINMNLTPSSGTLLFGEDSIGNQIVVRYYSWIVTHPDQPKPYIQVTYRGKKYDRLYLSEFCGCKYNCLYQSIYLSIGVSGNTIAMLCNKRDIKSFSISHKMEGHENYRKINVNKTGIKGNKAVFYIGNLPTINKVKYDPDQIEGCISSVVYMNKPIKMKVHGSGAKYGQCNRKCTDPSICNGGTCFETFSSAPLLCDCTNSIGSGNKCSIMPKRENKILNGTFTPKAVKMVWKTNDTEIIKMESKKYNVSIYVDHKQLRLKYNETGKIRVSYKILDNYVVFSYHIVIITFHDTYIEVEFPLLNKSRKIKLFTKVDNLIFSKLYLFSSNDGVIDVQQKEVLDNIVWSPFDESSTISMDKQKVPITSTIQQTIQHDTVQCNISYTSTKLNKEIINRQNYELNLQLRYYRISTVILIIVIIIIILCYIYKRSPFMMEKGLPFKGKRKKKRKLQLMLSDVSLLEGSKYKNSGQKETLGLEYKINNNGEQSIPLSTTIKFDSQ